VSITEEALESTGKELANQQAKTKEVEAQAKATQEKFK